jgi:plasmid stabilization system protein ParE
VLRVEYHPEAEDDLSEATEYLAVRRTGYGDGFEQAVRTAEEMIAMFPRIGRRRPGGVRRVEVHGFKYGLIYEVRRDSIFVLAVAHYSWHRGYWRHRLKT